MFKIPKLVAQIGYAIGDCYLGKVLVATGTYKDNRILKEKDTMSTPKKTSWWRLLCACWRGTIAKIDIRRQRNCKKHIWMHVPYQSEAECYLCGIYAKQK